MKYEEYIIDNLEEFTLSTRRLVFNGFGHGDISDSEDFIDLMKDPGSEGAKEMDSILSQNESLVIVKNLATKQKHKKKKIYQYNLYKFLI